MGQRSAVRPACLARCALAPRSSSPLTPPPPEHPGPGEAGPEDGAGGRRADSRAGRRRTNEQLRQVRKLGREQTPRAVQTPPPPRSASWRRRREREHRGRTSWPRGSRSGSGRGDGAASRCLSPAVLRSLRRPESPPQPAARASEGASGRAELPGGGDEVTAGPPLPSSPLPARDAPPGKGRGKVTGAQEAGGRDPAPSVSRASLTRSKIEVPSRPRPHPLFQTPLPQAGSRQTQPAGVGPPWSDLQPQLCDLGRVSALQGLWAPHPSNADTLFETLLRAGPFTKLLLSDY